MSRKPCVPKLPERDRRKSLDRFLTVLDQHPELALFSARVRSGRGAAIVVPGGNERSLILRDAPCSPERKIVAIRDCGELPKRAIYCCKHLKQNKLRRYPDGERDFCRSGLAP